MTYIVSAHGTCTGDWFTLPDNVTVEFTVHGGLPDDTTRDPVAFSERRWNSFIAMYPHCAVTYDTAGTVIPDILLSFHDFAVMISGVFLPLSDDDIVHVETCNMGSAQDRRQFSLNCSYIHDGIKMYELFRKPHHEYLLSRLIKILGSGNYRISACRDDPITMIPILPNGTLPNRAHMNQLGFVGRVALMQNVQLASRRVRSALTYFTPTGERNKTITYYISTRMHAYFPSGKSTNDVAMQLPSLTSRASVRTLRRATVCRDIQPDYM